MVYGITTNNNTEAKKHQGSSLPSVSNAEAYEKLLDEFIDSQDVNDNSKRSYRWAMKEFFNWIQKNGLQLDALNKVDIFNYKKHLITDPSEATGKTRTPLTINAYITALRIFYGWASRNGYYKDIAYKLKPVPTDEAFVKMHLTPEECRSLLNACKDSSMKNHVRDYAIMRLLLETGIREIEAIRAKIEDIKTLRGRPVLWIQRKGRVAKDKFVPLLPGTLEALQEYLNTRPMAEPSDPLFVTEGYSPKQQGKALSTRSIQGITKKYMRIIGLDSHEYSGHSLRHTTAVTIIRGGAGLYEAQKALGHSNPATTQKYLKSIERDDMLDNPPTALVAQMLASN